MNKRNVCFTMERRFYVYIYKADQFYYPHGVRYEVMELIDGKFENMWKVYQGANVLIILVTAFRLAS